MRITTKQSANEALFYQKPLIPYFRRKSRERVSRLFYVLLTSLTLFVQQVDASPQGGNIVGGSGSISQSGAITAINQNSAAMAINWNSYNISQNEIVNYIQPAASSISLNRIIGGSASQIHGQINANGQVVLVNPNGVFFGQSSSINVGGLIASGLDISPVDFMNGDYIFNGIDGTTGAVTNAGLINASLGGSVGLLGKQVSNEGLITANLGAVNLAAGNAAVLTFDRQGLIGIRVTEAVLEQDMGVDPALLNSGDIEAESGRVLLTASQSHDLFSAAVNSDGIEQATSVVVNADGSFTLGGGGDLVNSGNIDVSSTTDAAAGQIVMLGENLSNRGGIHADALQGNGGLIEIHSSDTTLVTGDSVISATSQSGAGGEVTLLGDKVGLFDATRVDASGNGGGQILIGGDYRGENQRVRNASAIYIGRDVLVDASAGLGGDGGRIIAWGNDSAVLFGNLNARGGSLSGDGGFVETSANYVVLDLSVDVGSETGAAGTWLIDPFNIDIGTCAGCPAAILTQPGTGANSGFGSVFTPDPGADSSLLTTAALLATLTGGANVLIETTGVGGMAEPNGGNITLNQDLDLMGSTINGNRASLTLRAEHNIVIDAMIEDSTTSDDSINLTLQADSNGINGGDVIINDVIDTEGGNFIASGANIAINDNVLTQGGSFAATADNITLDAAATIDTQNNSITLTANTNGTITVDGNIDTGGGVFFAQGAVASTGVSYTTTALETPSIVTNGGNVNIDVSANVDILGTVDSNGGALTVQGQDITLTDAQIDTVTGAVAFTGASFTSSRTNANEITQTGGGSVTMNLTGAINIGAEFDTDGGVFTVVNSASFNNFDLVNPLNGLIDTRMPLSIGVAGAIDITASGNVTLGAMDIRGDADGATITVDSGGSISLAQGYDFRSTEQSTLTFLADNDINFTAGAGIFNLMGSNRDTLTLNLTADRDSSGAGDINIDADIYTAGGDFTASGVNFVQGAVDLNTDDRSAGLVSTTSNGGDVFLDMDGGVTLGSIITDSDCGAPCGDIEGNLTIIAMGGDIVDIAGETLSIHNNTVITAFGNNVTLDENHDFDSDDDLLGTVNIVSANNVLLNSADDITFGSSTIDGILNVTTAGAGDILQSAAITVSGITTLTATGDVTLENLANDFSRVDASGIDVMLTDANDIVLGPTVVNDDLVVTAAGNGTIGQVGSIAVTDESTFIALGDAITLGIGTNNFSTIMVNGGDVFIRDADGLMLGTSNTTGSLDVSIIGPGDIDQVGDLVVAGNASFSVNGGRSIILNGLNNNFQQNISVVQNTGTSLQDVEIRNIGALDLGTINVSQNLTVEAGGNITNSGVLTVGGIVELDANFNSISLDNNSNNFTEIVVIDASNASIFDIGGLQFGSPGSADSNITGDLAVTTVLGDISDNNTTDLSVGGTMTLNIIAGSGSIALDSFNNDFNRVNIVNSAMVDIQDSNAVDIRSGIISGDLVLVAGGDITGSNGALVVNGSSTFTTSGGSSISLNNAANQLTGPLAFNSAGTLANVSLSNALAVAMPALTVSGGLSVTSSAGITQIGLLDVSGGTASLTSLGADVVIDSFDNDFLNLIVNGSNIAVRDVNGVNLGGAGVSGNLTVTAAGGTITQTGSLFVGGDAVFNATGNNITLDDPGNNFATIIVDGEAVTIRDATGLDFAANLGVGSIIGTSLDVVASADIRFNPDSIDAAGAPVDMTTSQGDFLGLGLADLLVNPHIITGRAEFISLAGTFGSPSQPIVIRIDPPGGLPPPPNINILSRGFFLPSCGGCSVNASGIDFGILASIAAILGDQLVDIESLGAIDPAIFTDLKNYSGEDVSILLPRDQLYEDEIEEQN